MGYSSSLPASISNIRTYLDAREKWPKFAVGPTAERPGPMLLNVAATEVKIVSRLWSPSKIVTRRTDAKKIQT